MKIIHAADLHLGSKIEAKLKDISEERKAEVRNSFLRLAKYAHENDIHVILLSGDVFDSDRPFKKDKDTFYSVIKQYPDIDFLYLRGNHDTEEKNEDVYPNLKTFSEEWRAYSYGNVDITGLELGPNNSTSFYSTLSLNPEHINIVMLHGTLSDSVGLEKIKLSNLKNKNIDYLALGHIHSFEDGEIDKRGHYAYSGCLEGRGFDETGEKGFVLLGISEDKLSYSFHPFCERVIREINLDVSSLNNIPSIIDKVEKEVSFNSKDIYRINLIGDVPFDSSFSAKDIESYLKNDAYFVNVKDKTMPLIEPKKYENDLSLKGEFVRGVYANTELSEEDKKRIVALGLKALEGRELDL